MRLYVESADCGRVYLASNAKSRMELPPVIQVTCPKLGTPKFFSNRQVLAEAERIATVGGAVIGGILGILAGPLGVVIGGTLGGLIGAGSETQDGDAARRFNQS